MLLSPSLPRPDLADRRTQLALAAVAAGALALAIVVAISTGNLLLCAALLGVGASPLLLLLALSKPYIFPYGLYVVLVPFDNLLKIGGAGTLTRLLGAASAVFVIAYAARLKRLSRPPLAMYAWLALLLWGLVSVMWAPDSDNVAIAIQQISSLVVMFAVFAVAPIDERQLRSICVAFVIGGILASIYGIYLLHQMPALAGDQGRLMIDVDNRTIDPNHFANSLLAPLSIALISLLRARKPVTMFVAGAALLIIFAGIVVSLSREALIASLAIFAVAIWFSRRRVLGFSIAIPLVVATPLLVPAIGQRMAEALSTGGAGRTSIWHVGWLAFRSHPVFGWGLGGAVEAYNQNYLAVFQLYNAGWDRPPHNTPLHMAIELGAIGLALMLFAYFATFRQMRGIARGNRLYDLRVALTGSLIALGIVSLFIDLFSYKYFWVVLVAIAQLRTVSLTRDRSEPAVVYEPPPLVGPAARLRATRT